MTSPSAAIRVFGPLRVALGDREHEITQRRERNVLAVLVAHRGASVSADRLVAEVWGAQAPTRALGSLQVAIARLRTTLEPDRSARAPAAVLVSKSGGYRLELADSAVDVWDFDRRASAVIAADGGSSDERDGPKTRFELAAAARSAWLGEPYPDCDPDSAMQEAQRLGELRLVVEEIRARALLDLGEAERAAADLAELLSHNPYRERLWALSALAHYRCARQDQALDTLRALRRRLVEDLGVDPTADTAALETAILGQDPALQAPDGAADRGLPGVRSGRVDGGQGQAEGGSGTRSGQDPGAESAESAGSRATSHRDSGATSGQNSGATSGQNSGATSGQDSSATSGQDSSATSGEDSVAGSGAESGTAALRSSRQDVPPQTPRTGSIGRDAAVGTVRGLLADLGTRPSVGFLVVSGEPGIGKTRLVQDLAHLAQADGARVVIGRCHPDFAPALWPWLPVARGLAGELAGEADERERTDPLTPLLAGSTPRTDQVDNDAGGLLRLFDAFGALLSRTATQRSLVVVLEDLHWADTTSLRLLAHLATTGVAGPILVVATIRTGEGEPSETLRAAMAAMSRAAASRIRLAGLSRESVGVLLGRFLDDHDPRLDVVVTDATGGNPFFVLEYARLLEVRDDLTPDRFVPADLPVPDGVTDVLEQRVGRLPADAVATLRTAALIGPTIDPDMISEIIGTPIEEVLDHLDLALASGILTERHTGYAFSHAMTREVLAAQWSAGRRIRMHDTIARALQARWPDDPDRLAEIAHHAYQAAALGPEQSDRAVVALELAAKVAEARQAFDESLSLWRKASETVTGKEAAVRRLPHLLGEARSLFRLARSADARTVVTRAVTTAAAAGRWSSVAQAATILNRAGVWTWREHGVPDEGFIAAMESALAWVDSATGARLLAALELEYSNAGATELADERGERAIQLARSTGDEALLAEVLFAGIMASYGPGKVPTRLTRTEELVTLSLRGELAAYADFVHAQALFAAGRVEEADAAAARCRAELSDLHHTGIEIPMLWWRLARARDRDDHATAAEVLAELSGYRERGVLTGTGLDLLYLMRTRAEGSPFPDELLAFARRVGGGMRALVSFEAMEAGRPDAALDLLGEPPAPGASDYAVLATYCLRVAVLASAGPGDALDADLDFLAAHTGSVATHGTIEHLGAVDYFLAVGEAARGNVERAAGHLEEATELLRRMDIRPWLRRADVLRSSLLSGAPGRRSGR